MYFRCWGSSNLIAYVVGLCFTLLIILHLYPFSLFRFLGVKVVLGMRDLQGEFFVFPVFFITLVTDLGRSRVCLFHLTKRNTT